MLPLSRNCWSVGQNAKLLWPCLRNWAGQSQSIGSHRKRIRPKEKSVSASESHWFIVLAVSWLNLDQCPEVIGSQNTLLLSPKTQSNEGDTIVSLRWAIDTNSNKLNNIFQTIEKYLNKWIIHWLVFWCKVKFSLPFALDGSVEYQRKR